MNIKFNKKLFFFRFPSTIKNSKRKFNSKKGWIIKLSLNNSNNEGYGEIAPLNHEHIVLCEKQLNSIPQDINKDKLLKKIYNFHPCIQSGINSALGEMENLIKYKDQYKFSKINQSAILVDSHSVIEELKKIKLENISNPKISTIKWKVGTRENKIEEKILEKILNEYQNNIRLRIDANGSWDRKCAHKWADILKTSKNLDWLEQPLGVDDIEGLYELNKKIPVALDESLLKYPNLINSWEGWQIRRPSQEKNPLKLLDELNKNNKFKAISSSFETGIGRRLLFHLSYIQLLGSTPKVPGLALNQMPNTLLFGNDPKLIWSNL